MSGDTQEWHVIKQLDIGESYNYGLFKTTDYTDLTDYTD